MRASKNLKLIATFALVVAVIFSVIGYRESQRQANIEKNGITVEGVIQRAESIHKGSGRKKVDRDILEVSYARVYV